MDKFAKARRSGGVATLYASVAQEQPPPANREIFLRGRSVGVLWGGRSWNIESLIANVAAETGTRTDWHMSGGRAHVLTLDDPETVEACLSRRFQEYQLQWPDAGLALGYSAPRAGVNW
jgi:hypothetical protein